MRKELSEMTLQELWELFPIFLTEHKPCWREWFEEEKENLHSISATDCAVRISHIGSTSINGIWAKPIIDILVEADGKEGKEFDSVKQVIADSGYTLMSSGKDRYSYNKGYTPEGFAEKVFHLHLRKWGDNDELYFRDYMNEFSEAAREYERMKLKLWKEYEHDRDGYTEKKSDFVRTYTREARMRYGERY